MTAIEEFGAGDPLNTGPFVPLDPMQVTFEGDKIALDPTDIAQSPDELNEQTADPDDSQPTAISEEGGASLLQELGTRQGTEGVDQSILSAGEAVLEPDENVAILLGGASLRGSRIAHVGERLSEAKQRAGNILAKASIAAFFALPAAEYLGSDVGSVEVTKLVNNMVTPNEIFSLAIVAGGIVLQSFISGIATANYRPLRNAGESLDEYMNPKDNEEVTPIRWLVSGAVKLPGKLYGAIGKPLKRLGMKLSGEPLEESEEPEQSEQPERSELFEQPERLKVSEESEEPERSGFAKSVGSLVKEVGEVNLLGTSGLILKRAVDVKGNPKKPSPWLVAKVSALMGASWFTLANIAEGPFRTIPFLHRPGAYVGQAYDILTNVNIMHPSVETIPGSVVVLGASAVLAAFGWDLAKFQQKKVSNKGQLETAA